MAQLKLVELAEHVLLATPILPVFSKVWMEYGLSFTAKGTWDWILACVVAPLTL